MNTEEFYWIYVFEDKNKNINVRTATNMLKKYWEEIVNEKNLHPIILKKAYYVMCSFGEALELEKFIKSNEYNMNDSKEVLEMKFNSKYDREILINEMSTQEILGAINEKVKLITVNNEVNSIEYEQAMKIKYYSK